MSISSDMTDHADTTGKSGTTGNVGKAGATDTATSTATPLAAQNLDLAYDHRQVITDLNVEIAPGKFTVIVGPNACGKSTLLRALARLMTPAKGTVLLDGGNIAKLKTKQIAKGWDCSHRHRSPQTASPWPSSWLAGATRTSRSSNSGQTRTKLPCSQRCGQRTPKTSRAARSTNSPAVSGNGSGWRWSSHRKHR